MVAALAVMAEGHAYLIKLSPIDLTDNEVSLMCKRNDLSERAVMLLGDEYPVDALSALDRFLDGVAPHNDIGELAFLAACISILYAFIGGIEFRSEP